MSSSLRESIFSAESDGEDATVCSEHRVTVGDAEVVVLAGGRGAPLLVLHDELGFPGWLAWCRHLARRRRLLIPLQPGFGRTDRVSWCRNYRDVAAFYARMLRESGAGPVDVVGFSAGGFIAAEMAAADPSLFRRMVLVAPLGLRPDEGEILDFLAMTMRSHLAATLGNHDVPEAAQLYGGEVSPAQFELFESARAETSRLGWEPFMYDPSLGSRLEGIGELPTLLLWGEHDAVVPRGCIDAYRRALPRSCIELFPAVGHRPEVEDPDRFVGAVEGFLDAVTIGSAA